MATFIGGFRLACSNMQQLFVARKQSPSGRAVDTEGASGPLASSMVYPSYTIVACVEACLSAYVGPDDSTHLATTVTANTAVVILRHGSPYAS